MKYLRTFDQRLKRLREEKKLTREDVAAFCMLDESVVAAWESSGSGHRCYPTVDNILDFCLKTGTPLDCLLDFEQGRDISGQLELLGFAVEDDGDLMQTIDELTEAFEQSLPDERERELLRRFRNSDDDRKQFIMQLMMN